MHGSHSGISLSPSPRGAPQSLHRPSQALTNIPAPKSSKVMSAPSVSPCFIRSSFGITILPRLSTFRINSPKKSKSAATGVTAPKNAELQLSPNKNEQQIRYYSSKKPVEFSFLPENTNFFECIGKKPPINIVSKSVKNIRFCLATILYHTFFQM